MLIVYNYSPGTKKIGYNKQCIHREEESTPKFSKCSHFAGSDLHSRKTNTGKCHFLNESWRPIWWQQIKYTGSEDFDMPTTLINHKAGKTQTKHHDNTKNHKVKPVKQIKEDVDSTNIMIPNGLCFNNPQSPK